MMLVPFHWIPTMCQALSAIYILVPKTKRVLQVHLFLKCRQSLPGLDFNLALLPHQDLFRNGHNLLITCKHTGPNANHFQVIVYRSAAFFYSCSFMPKILTHDQLMIDRSQLCNQTYMHSREMTFSLSPCRCPRGARWEEQMIKGKLQSTELEMTFKEDKCNKV